jgi:hypothetical protein
MKTSSAAQPKRPKRSTAANCLIVNQLATPGLGSLMAGRFVAGTVELTLSLLGFGFVMGWFFQIFMQYYRQMNELPPQPPPYPWMGKAGVIIFAAAWLLSWITSLSVLRESRRNEAAQPPPAVPPKIT